MEIIRRTDQVTQVELTTEELILLNNALNEVLNRAHIDTKEFQTRLGVTIDEARLLLLDFRRAFEPAPQGKPRPTD